MVQHFHRKVIAGVATLSILVTALGAGSASAQDVYPQHNTRNFGTEQAIVGLIGLALFGAIVAKNRKDKKDRHVAVPVQPHPHVTPVHPHTTHKQPAQSVKPLPKRAQKHVLPKQCLRAFDTNSGRKRLFVHRCMSRSYTHVAQLPQLCQRQIWTQNGPRAGWGARCLRKNGFQVAQF